MSTIASGLATPGGSRSRTGWAWGAVAVVAVVAWTAAGTQAAPWILLRPDTARAVVGYVTRMFPPDVSPEFLRHVATGVAETLAISVAGTCLAVVIGGALAAFAARDLLFDRSAFVVDSPALRLGRRTVYAGARLALNVLRTIPEIVWALVLVFAVGLGPFPGVLALGLHTGGVLGKLFGEVLEDVPAQALDSLRSCGASPVTVLAYGIVPQALPQCIAYSLYRWEVNIRAAAVLGFVGAGGLGQQVHIAINLFLEHRLLTLIAAIYLTVTLVDALSLAVRRRWS